MKLLAPNGKPSNLNEVQYRIVRTPAFKEWFGDWENSPENSSKVVDKNGEPLVLNRGNLVNQEDLGYTFNLGQNFLKKQSGNKFGFFFTNEIDIAKKYMLVDHFDEIRGGSITSVFMKSNKILDLLDFDLKIGQDNFVQGLIKKGINFNNGYNYLESKILDFNTDNYKYWGYNVFDYFDVFPELKNLFMENGFNSVVFYEMSRTYSKYKVYVAFESKQIKLADGSNRTFDKYDSDIRYKNGGNIPTYLYHTTSSNNFQKIKQNGLSVAFDSGYIGSCVDIGSSNKEVCEYFPDATIMAQYVGNPDENEWGKSKETTPKEFYKYVSKDDVPKKAINGEHTYHYIAQDGSNRDMNINETAIYFIYNIASDIHYFFKKTKHKTGSDLENKPFILDDFQIEPNGAYEHSEEHKIINQYANGVNLKKKLKKTKKAKGDCYYSAAQFVMNDNKTYIGTPYLVHAEVRGQGKIANIRYGHAWIEDDENIYDYSNGNKFVMPKEIYYAIGDIDNKNPLKYQKYTFQEAIRKMVMIEHYGEWDLEVDY